MRERGGELVTAYEPTVFTETSLNAIVMEDGQSCARLTDSPGTDQSDWGEVFRQTDNLLDQLVAAKVDPRGWRWRFSGHARRECKTLGPLADETAYLFWISRVLTMF